jgi:hypothetical protein
MQFRASYRWLPYAYNVDARTKLAPVDVSALAIVHFAGEPKPWLSCGQSSSVPGRLKRDASRRAGHNVTTLRGLVHETAKEEYCDVCQDLLPKAPRVRAQRK